MTPFFLVHHALAGGDGSYVQRFAGDVQDGVYERLGRREAFTGGVAGAEAAVPGSPGQSNAQVLLSPVLVALYSDAYFSDPQCRVEWSLFRERLRWHQHFTGRRSPALIGVPWSIRAVPPPVPIRQTDMIDDDFGAEFAAGGALRLIRAAPASAGYRHLVGAVVELIARARVDGPPSLSERDAELVRLSGRTAWAGGAAAQDPRRSAARAASGLGGERRWRMADPEHTRRPILRRAGVAERGEDDD
ncbi:hypothetical protein ND748_21045 [Frankia sp. AiPs1]|uniref:hypothetical protein n=1 Tax=Frankia sp. AiPs1 TaxID=573493 RepID=UPI002043C0DB|nr:hypothetical protein [Frankia sp. AiPs1]MCM3924142.1 hypothetical protein [Frankia sp. AiPs1]